MIFHVSNQVSRRSVQIGQFYHASSSSAPIAKIEWHPWGEAGSTLLVMTVDGKLRYDLSVILLVEDLTNLLMYQRIRYLNRPRGTTTSFGIRTPKENQLLCS